MSVTLTTEHYSFHLVGQTDPRYRRPGKATRVHMSGAPEPQMQQPAYSVKGQDAAVDAAWRAYNRDELRLMRTELGKAYAEAKDASRGADVPGWVPVLQVLSGSLRFTRKAGCSCGCSPGFVAEETALLDGLGQVDSVFVTVRS